MVEVIVSMLILAVSALAVTATISMVNSKQMRSAGGSSLDLQALSYAKETLESLKNNVSTDIATTGHGYPLLDTSYTAPCTKTAGTPCTTVATGTPPGGTTYTVALPGTSDLVTKVGGTSTRTYKVWDISSGTNTLGTDVAYKKVTVTVAWTDPV